MAVVESRRRHAGRRSVAAPFGHTVHPLVAGGATDADRAADGRSERARSRSASGRPILGRGYMEAIDDAGDRARRGRAGRAHRRHPRPHQPRRLRVGAEPRHRPSTRTPKGDVVIGRFGLKARIATLDDFTADAFQGDMGITSPLRPTRSRTPTGSPTTRSPASTSTLESVQPARDLHAPASPSPSAPTTDPRRAALRRARSAAACHVPSLQHARRLPDRRSSPTSTRPSTPISCSTTWATRSPTAIGSDGRRRARATGARRRSSACASTARSCTTAAPTTVEEAILAARRRRLRGQRRASTLFRRALRRRPRALLAFVGAL